jgi:putative methionine-R-sulfoxide reductase with GAF domain/HAMP domain-containing protein
MFGFKLNIQRSVFLQLFVIAILIVINYSVVASYDADLNEIEKTVDLVESNGTYSQEIMYLSTLMVSGKEENRNKLIRAIMKHDNNMRVMKGGGKSDENDSYIAPVPQELSNGYFFPLETVWQKYRDNAQVLTQKSLYLSDKDRSLNPEIKLAYDYLSQNNARLLERNDKMVEAYLKYFDVKQERRDFVLNIIFFINIALVLLMFVYISYNVVRPISQLNEIEAIITEGNFERDINYKRDDELGKVASSINRLFGNLRNATEFILDIGEGKLESKYQLLEEEQAQKKDRLGNALLEMRDKMREVAETDRQRNWSSEGLAKFADIFRNYNQSPEFTYIIISNLVKYTQTNQGALFLAEGENHDKHLELVSAYAYEKRKYVQKRIQKGEGIIGEVFQEGSTVYMTDVPDNYVHITSGLGEANPRCLLVVPLKLNDEIYGILELASFSEFEPYKIEFVEKLGESIASTFASVKSNTNTQKLLDEQTLLSQQMKAQEEEMRQNLEELMATQDEVERSRTILQEQKVALETYVNALQSQIQELQDDRQKLMQQIVDMKSV